MNGLRKVVAAAALAGFATSAASYSGLYVFGDSLSDAGNIALAVGADPTQVIPDNSYIPGLSYASGQFTNANVWTLEFASGLGLAPFGLPSLAGGGDFAFGGARANIDGPDLAPSLHAQEGMFLAATGGVAPSGALYVVQGGGNDARDALAAATTSPVPFAVIASAAASYAFEVGTIVDSLQAAGGKHIVVWNIPNLGLAPAVTFQGAAASFLGIQIAQAMNAALAARLSTESDVTLFDLYALQNSFAANPAAFGLANVTDACGALPGCDPSTYLFWDGIHPTSGGHALLAQNMLAVTAAIPEPEIYALMLGGLLVIALRRERP